MATDITNGKGGSIIVSETPAQTLIVPALGTDGGHKTARHLKLWNEGDNTVYVVTNAAVADYAEANAVAIPAGKDFEFWANPMRHFVAACATGETSTLNWGAE